MQGVFVADTRPDSMLSRFPNYDQADSLDVVDASSITRERFTSLYSNQNRPCLVKRAAIHWPALSTWNKPGYLREHSANIDVTVRSALVSEVIGWSGPTVKPVLRQQAAAAYSKMPFHDFLTATERSSAPLVADSCRFSPGSPLEPMKDDVGGVPFMQDLPRSRRYPPHRVFLYRNSYTDWHLHVTDETFMTQVIGTKQVLLLPPDEESWSQLRPVIEQQGYLWSIDLETFPGTRELRPLRVVVEPGDAVYIPVFWWHAVESTDDTFGATVAATFPSPLHINGDMRLPVARKLARTYIASPNAPLILGMIAYSLGYRLMQSLAGAKKQPALT